MSTIPQSESPGRYIRSARVVCLCGSTKFRDAFIQANLEHTLAGDIVLSIGCDMRDQSSIFGSMSDQERIAVKAALDVLHLAKIDLCDMVKILNVGGYIGESTLRELAYARMRNKFVEYLVEPEAAHVCGRPECSS